MNMISKKLEHLFFICFLLVSASIILQNGYILAALAAFGIWKFTYSKSFPHFTVTLFIGGIMIRILIMQFISPPAESDFYILLKAAQSLLQGDFSFNDTVYFSLWAYQSVFVAWEAAWLKIWNNPQMLVIINAVLASGSICVLYRLVRNWVSERAAQMSMILLTIFPFSTTFHTVLSNQIPSAFFLTLGVWFLICSDCDCLGIWRYPAAGLSMQLGNLLRSEGIIILVAILFWSILEILHHPKKAKQLFMGMFIFLIIYCTVNAAANTIVQATGLNPHGIKNGNPTWKFVTGLNYETSGGYSTEDWNLIYPTLDDDYQLTTETIAIQNHIIKKRLSASPVVLLRHIANKIRFQWCTDSLNWALWYTQQSDIYLTPLSVEAIYALLQQFDRALFFLALCLSIIGLLLKARCSCIDISSYFPYFVFFAAFCAFLLIEAQPRYAYLPQLYLFTASAFGFDVLLKETKNANHFNRCPLL